MHLSNKKMRKSERKGRENNLLNIDTGENLEFSIAFSFFFFFCYHFLRSSFFFFLFFFLFQEKSDLCLMDGRQKRTYIIHGYE